MTTRVIFHRDREGRNTQTGFGTDDSRLPIDGVGVPYCHRMTWNCRRGSIRLTLAGSRQRRLGHHRTKSKENK